MNSLEQDHPMVGRAQCWRGLPTLFDTANNRWCTASTMHVGVQTRVQLQFLLQSHQGLALTHGTQLTANLHDRNFEALLGMIVWLTLQALKQQQQQQQQSFFESVLCLSYGCCCAVCPAGAALNAVQIAELLLKN